MRLVSTGKTIASPEFYEKRQRAHRRRKIIYIILFIFLIAGLIALTYLRSIRISEVTVEGNKAISSDEVGTVTHQVLKEKYLGIIPKDNALLYPKKALRLELEKAFPRFSSIAFSQPELKTLDISVVEREPFALYCGEVLTPEESNPCYFLDESGYIFDLAPSFSSGVYFVYARTEPFSKPLRQTYLDPTNFSLLSHFIKRSKALGIVPTAVTFDAERYKLLLKNGGVVSWKRTTDLDLIYSNLESFLNEKSIKADKTFLSRVIELDLGTENKVFYKLKPSE
jgi:hypothetical protein